MNYLFRTLFLGFFSFQIVSAQIAGSLPIIRHQFIVVAHRGDHEHAPENTLAAFNNAIKDGADYIEIDLRTTKDSQMVIMHDASVDRMTDGKGLVKDLMFEDIRKLKVKNKVHPEWGEFQIPTFNEVLDLSKDKINIYLDFKNAEPALAYKVLLDHGMEKQVIVYINSLEQYYKWRKAAPNMPLMLSLPDQVKDTIALKNFISKFPVEILDGDYDQYSEEMIKYATQSGHLVLPDIQGADESPVKWAVPIKKGIKGLQTDHPIELINYLISSNLR